MLDRRILRCREESELEPGSLSVAFRDPNELLQRLFALAQAIANDFECFERMVAAERRADLLCPASGGSGGGSVKGSRRYRSRDDAGYAAHLITKRTGEKLRSVPMQVL